MRKAQAKRRVTLTEDERHRQNARIGWATIGVAVAGVIVTVVLWKLDDDAVNSGASGAVPHQGTSAAATLEMSSPQLGQLEGEVALEATFIAGPSAQVVDRLAVVEYFSHDVVSEDGIEPAAGCGGRDRAVLTLANAQLATADDSTYRIDQQREGDFTSSVLGNYEILIECYDRIQVDLLPATQVNAGESASLAVVFDESVAFDQQTVYYVDGSPPSTEVIDAMYTMFRATDPYFDDYEFHIAALAAHTHTGQCVAAALDLTQTTPRALSTSLSFRDSTLGDWLCNLPQVE